MIIRKKWKTDISLTSTLPDCFKQKEIKYMESQEAHEMKNRYYRDGLVRYTVKVANLHEHLST